MSTDPSANESGGFWRVVYRGDDGDPVTDWATLVQPGDIVRMGWTGGGEHTTTVLAKNPDGSLIVYDNDAAATDTDITTIGIHTADYWPDTIPTSITIYRLDPAHQFLITGGPQAEIIQGSTFNNLIQPRGGADIITAGAGDNEIQDTQAHLNGVTVTDFHSGDWLEVTDLAPAAAGVSYDSSSGELSVTQGSIVVSTLDLPAGLSGMFTTSPDGTGGTFVNLACFVAGTRLRTPEGDRPVETLRVGDRTVTLDGTRRPIIWVGHRQVDCRRHPRPHDVWPVRILAGAFGDGQPHRDLWLSPDHAVFINDVLIPVKHLVNGTGVARVPADAIVYYHIELDRHDVVLAEGLATESYLDTGNRADFANSGPVTVLHADFVARRWEAAGRAPLVVTGPELEAARRHLAGRAAMHRGVHASCGPGLRAGIR